MEVDPFIIFTFIFFMLFLFSYIHTSKRDCARTELSAHSTVDCTSTPQGVEACRRSSCEILTF